MENKTYTMASAVSSVAVVAIVLGLATSLPWIFALMVSIALASISMAAVASASGSRAPVALHRTAPRRRAVV